jgi:hypothetical protein
VFRKTLLTIATATAISGAAMGTLVSTASAAVSAGQGGVSRLSLDWRGGSRAHCYRYLRRFSITGSRYWLYRYSRCVRGRF